MLFVSKMRAISLSETKKKNQPILYDNNHNSVIMSIDRRTRNPS